MLKKKFGVISYESDDGSYTINYFKTEQDAINFILVAVRWCILEEYEGEYEKIESIENRIRQERKFYRWIDHAKGYAHFMWAEELDSNNSFCFKINDELLESLEVFDAHLHE